MMNNNELYHYGVPGMRWGHRKAVLRSDYKARVAKAYGNRDEISKAKADYKTSLAKAKEEYKNSPEGMKKAARRRAVGTMAGSTVAAGATAVGATLATIGSITLAALPIIAPMLVVGGIAKGLADSD